MRSGFLVIDKPVGITSHDVVAAVRAVSGAKKVGHTGTLDPFATGVLALAIGTTTRLVQYLDESIKVYDATISFGTEMDTGDPTGSPIAESALPTASREEVEAVLATFVGERMQTPPPYSAVKYKGKPLYHYARRGVKVEVNPRPIKIHDVQLRTYDQETLRVIISCSRGTYARVLAGEIAKALGSTGHLAALSRLRSGPFHLEDAVSMADLAEMVAATPGHDWASVLLSRKAREERVKWRSREDVWQALTPHLVSPVHALAHLPLIDIDDTQAQLVRIGTASFQVPFGVPLGGRMLVAKGADVIAVAENQRQGAKILRVMGDSAKRRRRGR